MVKQELDVPLAWERDDIEQRWAFKGGRFTQVNLLFTGIIALALTVAFYALMFVCLNYKVHYLFLYDIADSFINQQQVPYVTAFFSFWSFVILYVKTRKLAYQKRALGYSVVPMDHEFVLTPATVDAVMENIHATVDDPRHFVLFNRIMVALSNLRNLGVVGDVDDILRSQADSDESGLETSYSMLGAFVWAIPVLGFIGTVQGLSSAIGGFSEVLAKAADIEEIKSALKVVTGGLATAFLTTFQALVLALGIQLWLVYLKKSEEEFLDSCGDYCLRQVVNRLRMMPFQDDQSG
jgi:biopolymer transport protein ExbB/TolQ